MVRHTGLFSVLVTVAAMMLPGNVRAGLDPRNPGLPPAQAYGGATFNNNNPGPVYDRTVAHRASSLCVDCHTADPVRNPANPLTQSGSHFVTHYSGLGVRATENVLAYERTVAWGAGATYLSRYAAPAPPNPITESVTGSNGELICESCHNLVRNQNGGNNLLERYKNDEDPSDLCEGCHPAEASGPPAHHPLTAHGLNFSSPSVRAAPLAGSQVLYPQGGVACSSCHWGHGAQRQTGARVLRRGSSVVPSVLNDPVNVLYYAGNPEAGDTLGEIKQWCVDHPELGCDQPGMLRQTDLESNAPTAGQRLVTNRDPLCDSCHTYNDP